MRIVNFEPKKTKSMFAGNRPLDILCIHSQLMCQNDAIQKIITEIKVKTKYQKFRCDKLYIQGSLITKTVRDLEYFEGVQS